MSAELEDIKRHTMDALTAAIADHPGACADAIQEIVWMGPAAIQTALCGWSGLSLHGFKQYEGPGQPGDWWGIEAVNMQTGQQVSIDEVDDPGTRDAMRLIVCFGNDDHDTITAIVKTALQDPESLSSLMVSSVKIAAMVGKALMEDGEAE